MGQNSDAVSYVDQVVKDLIVNYQPERIILFGSVARGEADEYSDIDLILVKNTDQRFIQRSIEAATCISREVKAFVDILVYTPKELEDMIAGGNPFIEHALRDSKVLYEKSEGDGPSLAGPGRA